MTITVKDASGTNQTVNTLNDVLGVVGTNTDAANTATDVTPVSAMSVWKQLSSSIQIIAGSISSAKQAIKAAANDLADGAFVTIGTKADNKNAATDTTAVSAMSVWKQVSASAQAIAGVDKGAGTGGAATQRVILDSAQLGTLGQTTMSASAPVAPASDWVGTTALDKFSKGYYVTVAASQTAAVLQSTTGATGDYITGILVIPATTSPGNVLLLDNATSITVFAGGATSVSNLVPFFIPLGAVSRSGAWKLTTGASVSCIAIGKFS
jgi:hypothetical protein